MRDFKIRPATLYDIEAFYGRTSENTLRAMAIEWNAELAGIAGIAIEPQGLVLFSDMKQGLKPPKITIWRVAIEIIKWIQTLRLPIAASTDNPHFLDRLGLKYVCEHNEKKIYRLAHENSPSPS